MSKYCWSNSEIFTAEIKLSNYSKEALSKKNLSWTLSKAHSNVNVARGEFPINISQGHLGEVGKIKVPLQDINTATQLVLTLQTGPHVNKYDIWVYPDKEVSVIRI